MIKKCIFIDICKFFRPFNRDCNNREDAHERCGQARFKLIELKEMEND